MAEVGNMALPAKILKKGIEVSFYPIGSTNSINFLGWQLGDTDYFQCSHQDMVRISDARMSGTAFGTVVLHISPEAALGGNISHVRNGDMITLDVDGRTLSVDVSDEELEKRKQTWTPPMPPSSGYARLFHDHIEGWCILLWPFIVLCILCLVSFDLALLNRLLGPELGADFDFLKGCRGAAVPKESH